MIKVHKQSEIVKKGSLKKQNNAKYQGDKNHVYVAIHQRVASRKWKTLLLHSHKAVVLLSTCVKLQIGKGKGVLHFRQIWTGAKICASYDTYK